MAPKRLTIEHILCPTDFSDFSERAFRRAVTLGRWFGSRVTALHVVPFTSPAAILAITSGRTSQAPLISARSPGAMVRA